MYSPARAFSGRAGDADADAVADDARLAARELVLPAARFPLPADAATAASAAARMIADTFAAACEALAPAGGARGAAASAASAATALRMSVIGEPELVGCSSSRRGVPSRVAAARGGGERAAGTSRPVSKPMSAATADVGLGVASGAGPVDPLSPL